VRARLAKAGPDVIDRVHFQRRMNGLEYLNFVQQSDLLVETLGVFGGNSTYEALSTGTPILAYAGKHMRSQITIDLLTMIDLGDCVAADRENFIFVALNWRTTPPPVRRLGAGSRRPAPVCSSTKARWRRPETAAGPNPGCSRGTSDQQPGGPSDHHRYDLTTPWPRPRCDLAADRA